jgi:hypothetical protein
MGVKRFKQSWSRLEAACLNARKGTTENSPAF